MIVIWIGLVLGLAALLGIICWDRIRSQQKLKLKMQELDSVREDLRKVQTLAQKLQADLDISTQTNEELKRTLQVKDRFFSLIAHDLKSPFQALKGYSALLLDHRSELNEDERQQMIEKIAMAAEEAQGLLDNLLRWALLQQGTLRAQPEACQLYELVSEAIELLRLNAKVKGVALEMQVSPDYWVYADKSMLSTVLRNLLSNALKFTPGGQGRVFIKAQEEADSYLLWFIDNGIGMSPETLQKLRWQEGHSQLGTDREQGTGLGLRLCHQFMALHQSALVIESLQGQGTRIMMRWPKAKKSVSTVEDKRSREQARLLIIDDDLDNQDIFRIYLRGLPIHLDFAANGKQGVETFAQRFYDVVLMDLHMPELGGVEATKRLRKLEEQLGRTRTTVIAFSSSLLQDDIDAAIQAGCDAYVLKPIKKQSLLQTLDRYLKH